MKAIEVEVKKSSNKGSEVGIKKKRLRHMGNLSIDQTQLPEVKDWQVGEEYEIVVKVRQTAMREADKWQTEEYGLPEKSIIADFEILSASSKSEGSEKNEK
jgi:hypothetical protein